MGQSSVWIPFVSLVLNSELCSFGALSLLKACLLSSMVACAHPGGPSTCLSPFPCPLPAPCNSSYVSS